MAAKTTSTSVYKQKAVVKKRKSVNNDHYTLVVGKGPLGLFKHVRLVANYKSNLEEIVMSTQRYSNLDNAFRAAATLADNLNIKVVIEE